MRTKCQFFFTFQKQPKPVKIANLQKVDQIISNYEAEFLSYNKTAYWQFIRIAIFCVENFG